MSAKKKRLPSNLLKYVLGQRHLDSQQKDPGSLAYVAADGH